MFLLSLSEGIFLVQHTRLLSCILYKENTFVIFITVYNHLNENEIHLKRASATINKFNPVVMTCIRSNNDIKSSPSGKDSKSCIYD